ncbi:MAG: helix-turn-helix transcriptional regulator, partial [Bryobacteraceae bacterium]|nr:helix-turn-helix transcriptional regulator [Bryobacteraceae bacterium]
MAHLHHTFQFCPESAACEQIQPGRKLVCSVDAGWKSLLIRSFESPGTVETFETKPSPDQFVVLVAKGTVELDCFSNGLWRRASYRPGVGGLTAGFNSNRLRWRSIRASLFETIHIHIPHELLTAVEEEHQRCGYAFRQESPDTLVFADPVIYELALSLKEAVRLGAPDLYAESAAQFLAVRLLSVQSPWGTPPLQLKGAGIADRRLKRVLEFMQSEYMNPLTLDQLGKEAGVSRFHFVRLFKEK